MGAMREKWAEVVEEEKANSEMFVQDVGQPFSTFRDDYARLG